MALADKLADVPQRNTGKPCSVGALEDHLTGSELDFFRDMVYAQGLPATKIFAAVQAEAVDLRNAGKIEDATVYSALSLQQINRHRSRGCRCFRVAA